VRHHNSRWTPALLALAVVAAACGGADDPGAATTTAPPGTAAQAGAAGEYRPGRVGSIDEAQKAVVQIVARGSFRDPEVGFSTTAGSGSGFIIRPDGLAVTNNHVVTGAATLEVFIGGDTTRSYNATVVGVSECNDLALIDIDGPDDLPYFDWYDGEIRAGLEVWAAGFPLGDPEFTLTKGIVAKAKAGGDLTGTSSIDHTIEHDANIHPGNSGGPLLTADGTVAGVNYAGGAVATTTAQFFAIEANLAREVVSHLESGNFESLGINGWAVNDEAAGITGIWVAGVEPGSPASKAQILPGDVVLTLNGLPMGQGGTFKDYCDVIRTAGDRPIAVEVLRFDTSEVLRGEINGDQPLTLAFSFAEQLGDDDDLPTGDGYASYDTVTDDTGVLTVEVPAEWSDRDTSPGADEAGNPIPYIAAAPSLEGLFGNYNTPGMVFAAVPVANATIDEWLQEFSGAAECTDGGVFTDYDDGVFAGSYQIWEDCAGTATDYLVLATLPKAGGPYLIVTAVQLVSDADLEALDRILRTFNLVG
jgi:serine protease Do